MENKSGFKILFTGMETREKVDPISKELLYRTILHFKASGEGLPISNHVMGGACKNYIDLQVSLEIEDQFSPDDNAYVTKYYPIMVRNLTPNTHVDLTDIIIDVFHDVAQQAVKFKNLYFKELAIDHGSE